jgi:hypothetical protein
VPALRFEMMAAAIPTPFGEAETALPVWDRELVDVDIAAAMFGKPSKRGPDPEKTKQIIGILIDLLREAGQPVPRGEVFDRIGKAGHIGELKADQEGRLRWSGGRAVYRAMELMERNPEQFGGCMILTTKVGKRVFWSLSPDPSHAHAGISPQPDTHAAF